MNWFSRHWDKLLLTFFILTYIIVLGSLSILRHNSFASGFDLSNMNQTAWNTLYGHFFALSDDRGSTVSRFSIHSDLILIFLSPLYLLWNTVRVLLIAQSIFLALGAIPVYLLSQKLQGKKFISVGLALVYLLNPALMWTNMYDFHGVSLVIPFFLFAFYFAYIKKWKWYVVFIFLALLTKEEISLSVAWFGIFIFLFFREKRIGIITFFAGIAWFFLMVFVVIPHFSVIGKHWALSWYQFTNDQTGQSEIIPSVDIIMNRFLFAYNINDYYISLLRPFAFLPLLGLPFLLLALPELTVNVLSTHGQMRSIVFHYDSGITPWLMVSTIFAVYYLSVVFKKLSWIHKYEKWLTYGVVSALLLVALRVNYHYSPLPTTPSCWCITYQVSDEDREFEKLLHTIPREASITSSPEIRPHVTRRVNSFVLPVATSSADFIAIIDQNRMVGNYNPKDFELKLIDVLNKSDEHTLVKHIGHFYLYKRNDFK